MRLLLLVGVMLRLLWLIGASIRLLRVIVLRLRHLLHLLVLRHSCGWMMLIVLAPGIDILLAHRRLLMVRHLLYTPRSLASESMRRRNAVLARNWQRYTTTPLRSTRHSGALLLRRRLRLGRHRLSLEGHSTVVCYPRPLFVG